MYSQHSGYIVLILLRVTINWRLPMMTTTTKSMTIMMWCRWTRKRGEVCIKKEGTFVTLRWLPRPTKWYSVECFDRPGVVNLPRVCVLRSFRSGKTIVRSRTSLVEEGRPLPRDYFNSVPASRRLQIGRWPPRLSSQEARGRLECHAKPFQGHWRFIFFFLFFFLSFFSTLTKNNENIKIARRSSRIIGQSSPFVRTCYQRMSLHRYSIRRNESFRSLDTYIIHRKYESIGIHICLTNEFKSG